MKLQIILFVLLVLKGIIWEKISEMKILVFNVLILVEPVWMNLNVLLAGMARKEELNLLLVLVRIFILIMEVNV